MPHGLRRQCVLSPAGRRMTVTPVREHGKHAVEIRQRHDLVKLDDVAWPVVAKHRVSEHGRKPNAAADNLRYADARGEERRRRIWLGELVCLKRCHFITSLKTPWPVCHATDTLARALVESPRLYVQKAKSHICCTARALTSWRFCQTHYLQSSCGERLRVSRNAVAVFDVTPAGTSSGNGVPVGSSKNPRTDMRPMRAPAGIHHKRAIRGKPWGTLFRRQRDTANG